MFKYFEMEEKALSAVVCCYYVKHNRVFNE